MIEEAITRAEAFSVMYTPFATKIRADKIEKVKEVFIRTHPAYVDCIYTGKSVVSCRWLMLAAMATITVPFGPCLLLLLTGGSFNLKNSNVNLFLRL